MQLADKRFFKCVTDLFKQCITQLQAMHNHAGIGTKHEDMADHIYALKESIKFIEKLKKETEAELTRCERIFCFQSIEEHAGEACRTDYCTVSPKVRQHVPIPKLGKDPELYYALMDHIGVQREISDRELVRLHWPAFIDWLSESQAAGKPLPPGLDPTAVQAIYSTICRAKGEIIEPTDALETSADERNIAKGIDR